MEDLLAREEELIKQMEELEAMEELRVKQDIRLVQNQPIRLDYGTHEGKVVMELCRMLKSDIIGDVLLWDAIFNYGRIVGIQEERARRARRRA